MSHKQSRQQPSGSTQLASASSSVPVPAEASVPATRPAGGLSEARPANLKEVRESLVQGLDIPTKQRRPTYNQWDKESLLIMVSAGVSLSSATAAVGCSLRTFYRWLAEDPVFKQRYYNDRSRAETDPLEMIREHAKHNLKAAMYLHKNAQRRQRRRAREQEEPAEKKLGQVEIILTQMFNDLAPLVGGLDEPTRSDFQKVFAGHLGLLEKAMEGLWRADEEEIVKRESIFPPVEPAAPSSVVNEPKRPIAATSETP